MNFLSRATRRATSRNSPACRPAGLAYFADAEPATMFVQNYGEQVRGPLLRECGGSQVMMEQYLDFLVNRSFRQTLLVQARARFGRSATGSTQRAFAPSSTRASSSRKMAAADLGFARAAVPCPAQSQGDFAHAGAQGGGAGAR
jgi:hypothetical protein